MSAYMKQFLRLRNEADDGGEGGGDGDAAAAAAAAASTAPVTPFGSFYNEGGGLNRERVDALGEEYAPIKGMLEKYQNKESDLIGGIKHLNWTAGQKSLQKLPADADDAQKHQHNVMVKEYFGVPDGAEGYGIKKPDNIPDEMWDQAGTDKMLSLLHEHNASPELVQALAASRTADFEALIDAEPQRETARVDEVNKELQAAFGNDLPAISAQAMKGLAVLGAQVPESGNMADLKLSYTQIAEMGQRVTELISEDAMSRGMSRDTAGNSAGTYREQAIAVKTDPSNSFNADFNSDDPHRQRRAQAEYTRLMSVADSMEGKA